MDDFLRGDERERPILNSMNWTKAASAEEGVPDMDRLSPGSTGDVAFGDAGLEAGNRLSRDRENDRTPTAVSSSSGSGGRGVPPHSSSEPRQASAVVPPELVPTLIAELRKEIRKMVKEEIHQQHENDNIAEPRTPQTTPGAAAPSTISSGFKKVEPKPATVTDEDHISTTCQESTTPTESQPSVHFTDDVVFSATSSSRTQSRKHRKSSTEPEVQLSAIDHTWGVLFDAEGSPTKRLEQILRGLAKYIGETFMPGPTIVIGPDKLAAFYSLYAIDKEPFPFSSIFKAHTTKELKGRTKEINVAIADIFRDLKIEYHLVQTDLKSQPTIPALTPEGFAQWLIKNIQAYPEEEAERLGKVMSACPIEADSPLLGTPERLPKQLSRHLLPAKYDRKARRILDEAVKDFMIDTGLSSTGSPTTESKSRSKLDTPYQPRERRESVTSPRSHHAPPSSDWKHSDSHGSHEHHRRSSTTRESYSRGQENLPSAAQSRSSRASLGSIPQINTSHLQIPQSPGAMNRVPSRSRSPQTRSYRSSYPEVHNTGHRSSLSASSAATMYTPTTSSLPLTVELPTVRERDKREKNDQDYHVYASPRVSLSSLEDAPKVAGGSRRIERSPNRPRRLTAGDARADLGEKQENYYVQDPTASRGPTFEDDD